MTEEIGSPNETLPNQQEEPLQQIEKPEKKGLVKALALLEVGLIEVLFVGVVIILLFGTLNYFNILRLSELFPNQLGFLPHRQQSSNVNTVTIAPTISPSASLLEPAKETLMNVQLAYYKNLTRNML